MKKIVVGITDIFCIYKYEYQEEVFEICNQMTCITYTQLFVNDHPFWFQAFPWACLQAGSYVNWYQIEATMYSYRKCKTHKNWLMLRPGTCIQILRTLTSSTYLIPVIHPPSFKSSTLNTPALNNASTSSFVFPVDVATLKWNWSEIDLRVQEATKLMGLKVHQYVVKKANSLK